MIMFLRMFLPASVSGLLAVPLFTLVLVGMPQLSRADDLDDKLLPLIPAQYAKDFMEKSLKGIHFLNCDGVPCRQTDEFELLNPPLSNDDTRQVMVYGIKGALAWWCGLDEARGAAALDEFAQQRGYNARQAALSSAIQGTFMRMQKAVFDTSGKSCDPETKAELDVGLPKGLK